MKDKTDNQLAPGLSFKERQRRAREEAILDAAEEVLAERGWHALSMEEIAARVGIATGTIYLHFANKDALLVAVMARGLEGALASIAGLDPTIPALMRLRDVLSLFSRKRAEGAHLIADDLAEFQRLTVGNARCSDLLSAVRRRLESLVDEGKRSGEIDPGVLTPVAVNALFALLSPRTYSRMLAATDAPPAAVHDAVIRLYLRGIAAEPAVVDRLLETT